MALPVPLEGAPEAPLQLKLGSDDELSFFAPGAPAENVMPPRPASAAVDVALRGTEMQNRGAVPTSATQKLPALHSGVMPERDIAAKEPAASPINDVRRQSPSTQDSAEQRWNPLDAALSSLDEADQADLRNAGRAARGLAQESVNWLRPALESARSLALSSDAADLFGELQRPAWINEGRAGTQGIQGYQRMAATGAGTRQGLGDDDAQAEHRMRLLGAEPGERDAIREAIQFLRVLLDHPMSWFVIALLVIGMLAVSAAKRWLK